MWARLRILILGLLGGVGENCSDWDLINFQFPGSASDKEGVWLIGTYVDKVWEDNFVRGGQGLRLDQFFGFLRFKYKMANDCGLGLRVIPGLFV